MKLNIQLFASGSKIFDADSYLQGKIEWSAVGNVTTNKSPVVAKLYARRTNSSETKGKSWNGFITIDGSKSSFSSLDKTTAVSNNWVLMHTYTKEVAHNSDGTKTITIAGSITGPSGTSLSDNTSKESFTVTLDDLHRVPSDVTYTMIETNPKLIDLGIADNVFVKDLSIKSFNITGTLYDDATIKKYAIFNRLNVFSTTTLPVIVDLTQNELQTDLTYVTQIPIRAQIVDSFETAGYSTNDLYDYVEYNKIALIETSTTAKRNGQTSGKVRLNVKGTYFNGDISSAVQSGEYKPIIKYKFWKLNDEEPTTFDYQIPSENITISDGTYSVSNYEIGTTDETQPNWFNPDYAYRVKIYVEDNFTIYISQDKSIPVGQATWTEYPNRVDFKKISTKKIAINGKFDDEIDSPLQVYDDDGNLVSGSGNTYSTEEQRIGTWIDGKPIYRKVIPFKFSSSANKLSINHNITNLGYAIKAYGFIPGSVENRFIPQFYYNMDTIYSITIYHISSTTINIFYGDYAKNNLNTNQCYIIIEYTKTTD